jgi:hypothetical protein
MTRQTASLLPAGAIASARGFGTGSLLTSVLAVRLGTRLAVAAVSVPHGVAAALRFWLAQQQPGEQSGK